MIHRRVSAVLQLRDGFLGRPVEGNGARCQVDGAACRPQAKAGGYLVWTDLSEGMHRLTVCLPGFQPEEIAAEIRENRVWEGCASLKPGVGYPYGRGAVSICLTIEQDGTPLADTEVWIAGAGEAPLKIAQDKAAAGAQQLRLFSKASVSVLPVPGIFLVDDKKPELVQLQAIEQGEGTLATPLAVSTHEDAACCPPRDTGQMHRDRFMCCCAVQFGWLCFIRTKCSMPNGRRMKTVLRCAFDERKEI